MPGIPSKDASFVRETPRNYALTKYKRLEERYDILNEHMLDITDDNERYLNDLRYLEAFIDWKNLNEEFLYFKNNAYEKYDEDLPFSRLTL